MTDTDLLILAANAAGIRWRIETDDGLIDKTTRPDCPKIWNPLVDDGDAFRLAVKLQMDVSIEDCGAWVNDRITVMDIDRYAATRRAIVLAAARIGEFGEP